MPTRRPRGRWLVVAATLTVLAFGLLQRQSMAQTGNVSSIDDPELSKAIDERKALSAELEALAASQREQLRKTEETARRARLLLDRLEPAGQRVTHDSPEEDKRRHAKLPAQSVVEGMGWKWSDERATARFSADNLGNGLRAELELVRDKPKGLTLRLVQDGREIFSWQGHSRTVFVTTDSTLYRADFHPSMNGCALVAYDLKNRQQKWKTALWGIGPRSHSQYSNQINLTFDGKYLIVYGNEAYGQYIELVDPESGRTVGHKVVPPTGQRTPLNGARDPASPRPIRP